MRQGRFIPFSERSERAKGARRVKKRHSAAFLAKAGQSYAEARDCLPLKAGEGVFGDVSLRSMNWLRHELRLRLMKSRFAP